MEFTLSKTIEFDVDNIARAIALEGDEFYSALVYMGYDEDYNKLTVEQATQLKIAVFKKVVEFLEKQEEE